MSEFVDRMTAQREVLQVVNSRQWREELYGLSSQAISRWTDSNSLGPDSQVVALVRQASERLSFLANKSQEQISDEYRRVSGEVGTLTRQIGQELGPD